MPLTTIKRLSEENLSRLTLSDPTDNGNRPGKGIKSARHLDLDGMVIDHDYDWVFSDGSKDSSDSSTPHNSVAQALAKEHLLGEKPKKAHPSAVTSYIASNRWQGHRRMLDDWRLFVEDSRKTSVSDMRRKTFKQQVSEPILFSNRGEESRRISTGMIASKMERHDEEEELNGSRDSLSVVDTWEVEQRKKVLKRSLKEAKRSTR
jgi:hypothetical protein